MSYDVLIGLDKCRRNHKRSTKKLKYMWHWWVYPQLPAPSGFG